MRYLSTLSCNPTCALTTPPLDSFGLQEVGDTWRTVAGTWLVPFTVAGPSPCNDTRVLQSKASTTAGPWDGCAVNDWTWFKANRDAAGFYRATFSTATWQALAAAGVEVQTALSTADRAQVLDDAFALVSESMLEPVRRGSTCQTIVLHKSSAIYQQPSRNQGRLFITSLAFY